MKKFEGFLFIIAILLWVYLVWVLLLHIRDLGNDARCIDVSCKESGRVYETR